MNLLLPIETKELERCEAVISGGLQTFIEVGNALLAIRDKRLYRSSHESFEDYCRDRWEMARSRAYQLIDAAKVMSNLAGQMSTIVDIPSNEAQARPLARLPEPEQAEAWKEAKASAPNGKPTAKQVEAAVDKRAPKQLPAPSPKAAPPARDLFDEDDEEQQKTVETKSPLERKTLDFIRSAKEQAAEPDEEEDEEEVDPEDAETLFRCPACGRQSHGEVWHCRRCNKHCLMTENKCQHCGSPKGADSASTTTPAATPNGKPQPKNDTTPDVMLRITSVNNILSNDEPFEHSFYSTLSDAKRKEFATLLKNHQSLTGRLLKFLERRTS